MRRHFHGSLSFLMILTASAILVAQISVDVRLVNVIATVTDDRGRYVGNLAADDFTIEEDGRLQKVSHFSQDNDVPISVGVLLDTSGSMERKLRTAVDAVAAQPVELDLSEFEGRAPVEMLGKTRFPVVTSHPYQLALSPFGFYWFRIEQADR